ncbi:hypothetical protein A5N82_07530 [Christensenella minuta]|nr:hypothetical protein B1H56_07870 [Christensenella minuta]OAQ37302.1 hypothetical protein A5N82_07530 [Christensenella minuta]
MDNLIFSRKYAGFPPAENAGGFLKKLTGIFPGIYRNPNVYFLKFMHNTAVPFFDARLCRQSFRHNTLSAWVFEV